VAGTKQPFFQTKINYQHLQAGIFGAGA